MKIDFDKWRKERDTAVASLSVDDFRAFYNRWMDKGVYEDPLPADDDVIRIMIHKMACTGIETMPGAIKERAGRWLDEHGYARGMNEVLRKGRK